jgi:hypothetical protein
MNFDSSRVVLRREDLPFERLSGSACRMISYIAHLPGAYR